MEALANQHNHIHTTRLYPRDADDDSTPSKSCLAFSFGKHKKKTRSNNNLSSSVSTQSSQPSRANEQSSLLPSTPQPPRRDLWTLDEHESQPSTTHGNRQATVVSPEPARFNSHSNMLALPTPVDRSHKTRLAHERQQRKSQVFQGELEPEGMRGQEASIHNISGGSGGMDDSFNLPMRSFDRQPSQPQPSQPQQFQPQQQSQQSQQQQPSHHSQTSRSSSSVHVFEDDDDFHATSGGQASSFGMMDKTNSISRSHSQDPSTSSSQDIEQMMSDFNREAATRQPQHANLLHMPPSPPPMTTKTTTTTIRPQQFLASDGPDHPTAKSTASNNSRQGQPRKLQSTPQSNRSASDAMRHPVTPPTPPLQASPLVTSPDSRKQRLAQATSTNSHPTTTLSHFRSSAPVDVDDSSFVDPDENVKGINAMAIEHVLNGDYDMALAAFQQVLQVYQAQHGTAHALVASAHHNLGTVHSKRAGLLADHTLQQRHCREQALSEFQAAARSARDGLGRNHPNVAVSLVRIGFLLLQAQQYEPAVLTFQEALRIRHVSYGPRHPLVANLYNNLGVCHMHLQQFVTGREQLTKALDIQQSRLSDMTAHDNAPSNDRRMASLEVADTLCNIGGLCLEWIRRQGPDARHVADAESAFIEALQVRIWDTRHAPTLW